MNRISISEILMKAGIYAGRLKLLFLSLLFILFLFGCKGPAKMVNFSVENRFVIYDKVKVNFDSNIGLKGYITIVKDSFICFKFYGPLGYEVVGGRLADAFQIIDYFNNKKIDNAISEISGKSGILVNERVVENILVGRIDSLKSVLLRLNPQNVLIGITEDGNKKRVVVQQELTNGVFTINYSMVKNLPKKIQIQYSDIREQWSVQIDIISVTNQQKKCIFEG